MTTLSVWPSAYRITSARLTLRSFSPSDAPQVVAAVRRNRESLSPWLDLPVDPTTDTMVTRLRRFRAQFDLGEVFHYVGFHNETDDLVGTISAEPIRGRGVLVGGWLDAGYAGVGIALEAVAAIIRVGLGAGAASYVELRIRSDNEPSRRLAARLGFAHEATLRNRARVGGEHHDEMIWTLLAGDDLPPEELTGNVGAFDAIGKPLL